MESPSSERGLLKCLLCDANSLSKYDLIQHIYQHLFYRKYQCTSCTENFHSEEERDMHCIQEGHTHTHGMKFSPYCELYVSLLLKDAEYAACHGIEAVVEQRTKANLPCLVTGDIPKKKSSSSACESEDNVKIPSAEDNKENKKKKETKEAIPSSKAAVKETPKTEKDDEQNSGAPPGRDQLRARNTVSEEKGKKSRYPTRNHSEATDANSKADMSGEADELRNGSFAKPKAGGASESTRDNSKMVKELRTFNVASICLWNIGQNADIHRLELAQALCARLLIGGPNMVSTNDLLVIRQGQLS